jgi:hypothetical protein
LHLIADAPQDQRYTNMLAAEVTIIRFDMCVAGFTDATPGSEIAGARDAFMHYRNETPTQRLAAIGITLGSPPFRQPALPIAPAPAYRALPAINTDARRDLVAQLVTAAGPLTTSGGFQNPEAFFRLMANYNYANRIALYREVLRAQGFTTAADAPEHMVRRILMINFVTNSAGQKSFAGLERYFRMVSDAPRDTTYRNYLTGEFRHLIELGYPAQFIDRNQPGIQANYQRLFSIGGNNPNLLPSDPYSRLELIGVPLGRPPVLNPALPARGRFSTAPILWDRLDLAPEPLHRTRGLALAMQGDTARDSVTPVSLSLDGLEQTHYSPLAHV